MEFDLAENLTDLYVAQLKVVAKNQSWIIKCSFKGIMYSARNLEMSIRFSLKSRPSERFHRAEMSQIKAEISLHTNVKLNFHKNVGCQ